MILSPHEVLFAGLVLTALMITLSEILVKKPTLTLHDVPSVWIPCPDAKALPTHGYICALNGKQCMQYEQFLDAKGSAVVPLCRFYYEAIGEYYD